MRAVPRSHVLAAGLRNAYFIDFACVVAGNLPAAQRSSRRAAGMTGHATVAFTRAIPSYPGLADGRALDSKEIHDRNDERMNQAQGRVAVTNVKALDRSLSASRILNKSDYIIALGAKWDSSAHTLT